MLNIHKTIAKHYILKARCEKYGLGFKQTDGILTDWGYRDGWRTYYKGEYMQCFISFRKMKKYLSICMEVLYAMDGVNNKKNMEDS